MKKAEINTLEIGKKAPDFTLPCDNGEQVRLKDYRGRKLVLYFYPRDDTSGCTLQAHTFTAYLSDFTAKNTEILGVSADSPQSHDKFKAKHKLAIKLASDESHAMLKKYGVWVEKNMYGRKYMGIERTSFLLDEKGIIQQIWRKVKVKGHVEEVLTSVASL